MTEAQQRALWASAFRSLAEAILSGRSFIPTSVELWNQFVTPEQLLRVADHTGDTPLPIQVGPTRATVTVPTGEQLGLPIAWKFQADRDPDGIVEVTNRESYHRHNDVCVDAGAPDSDPAMFGDPLAFLRSVGIVRAKFTPGPTGSAHGEPDLREE